MDDIVKDKRFAHIVKDPRFRRMPKKERKVKIDKRFKEMFTNEKFKLKCSVDKRGRPIKQSTNENLKRFYDISDEEESSESDSDSEKSSAEDSNDNIDLKDVKLVNESDRESTDEEEEVEKKSKKQLKKEKINKDKNKKVEEKKKKKSESKDPRFSTITADSDIGEVTLDKTSKEETINEPSTSNETKHQKDKENKNRKKKGKKATDESSDSESPIDTNALLSKAKGDIDFARGEAELSSSSEEEDFEEEEDELIHNWAELDEDVGEVEEATSRLAICNLDWDRISSRDIFTALNSFKTNKGFIKSVKIYLSQYGKERIEEEKAEGPKELKAIKHDEEADEEMLEDKQVKESFTENLRKYQFNRLKYYYAVVDCDSAETADHLYSECDGNEYETSCTKFDIRFIPEDMEFDETDKRSECEEMPHGYEPDLFKNYAMAFSKAELTWDETDRGRQNLVSKQFSVNVEDLKEDDLKAYLASSSDEEDADYSKLIEQSDESDSDSESKGTEDKQIDKYKRLLLELDNDEKEKMKGDIQMEITWEMGLKGTTEELVKKKTQSSDKTVWEQYMDKKKEKKKEKRKKKQKDAESSEDEEKQEGAFETFSDDDVPADLRDDPFFADEMDNTDSTNIKEKGKKKKKKKDKKKTGNTEEDDNQKAALSLLMMDEDDNRKHFNLKKIIEDENQDGKKKKKKKKKQKEEVKQQEEDDFELNVQDPRFSAVYESHLFNIDPSAPEYKKTKGSEALVTEKLKRRTDPGSNKRAINDKLEDSAKKMKLDNGGTKKDESLASLVKSVKAKTKSFQSSKPHKER